MTGPVRGSVGPASPPSTATQRRVLWVAVLGSFVAFLDGTIVNVALPSISAELGGGLTTQQWVVDAYLITLGALILVAGSVSDAFGRVLVLRIGLVGFGLASVAITVAPAADLLIVARAVQGAAGAFLVPSSLALITAHFSGTARGRAIGIWTAMTTAAMIVGPVIGGLFVDLLSWRWAFLINVLPIGATLLLLARGPVRDLPRSGVGIDWAGGALCVAGLGGLVFGLIEGENLGWSSLAITLPLAGGAIAFTGFLVRQAFTPHPILPLEMFRERNFTAGNLATALIYGGLSLSGFVVVVYLQQNAGLSATLAGLASLPMTLLLVFLSSRVGVLNGRWGPRVFMTVGPVLMGCGALLLLTVSEDFSYWWQMLPSMVLSGLGLALTVTPLTSAVLGAISSDRSGIASAVNNAVSRVAGLIAIAVLALVVGGSLDLSGLHRAAIATAALMFAGGAISFVGIRSPASQDTGRTSSPAGLD